MDPRAWFNEEMPDSSVFFEGISLQFKYCNRCCSIHIQKGIVSLFCYKKVFLTLVSSGYPSELHGGQVRG
jgi:hypothetical protein